MPGRNDYPLEQEILSGLPNLLQLDVQKGNNSIYYSGNTIAMGKKIKECLPWFQFFFSSRNGYAKALKNGAYEKL